MNNILNAMGAYPWAILEQELEKIIAIASRQNDIQAVLAKGGQRLENTHKTMIRDGVAIIPVYGSIFRRANLMTEVSGATSTEIIARDFNSALNNKDVNAIVFDMDSGGGQANGISELSSMIFNARGKKPIKAYAGGSFASACYWLGSSCDEVIINNTGIAGSIGAMLSFDDDTEAKEKNGIRQMKYISSVSPHKNSNSELQKLVDSLGAIFVENVARNRGVTTDFVLKNYGQGGLFVGQEAVDAGLADRVGTLEEVIASLSNKSSFNSARFNARQRQINLMKESL